MQAQADEYDSEEDEDYVPPEDKNGKRDESDKDILKHDGGSVVCISHKRPERIKSLVFGRCYCATYRAGLSPLLHSFLCLFVFRVSFPGNTIPCLERNKLVIHTDSH